MHWENQLPDLGQARQLLSMDLSLLIYKMSAEDETIPIPYEFNTSFLLKNLECVHTTLPNANC